MKQQVSAPVAVIVVILALIVFAALFHNPRLAPPETVEPGAPPEPPINNQEVVSARQGLRPLGVVAVLPPLVEDRRKGVRVAAVAPNSPADCGVKVGDRIESFAGHTTVHPMGLAGQVNQVKPDQKSKLVVLRAGKNLTLTVTGIVALPPEELPHPSRGVRRRACDGASWNVGGEEEAA